MTSTGCSRGCDEALVQARAEGDYVRMAEAATGFRSTSIWYWRLVGSDDPQAVEVHRGVPGPRGGPRPAGAVARQPGPRALRRVAPGVSDPALWESLEVARQSGDAEVLRDCLGGAGDDAVGSGDARRARGVRARAPDPGHVSRAARSPRSSSSAPPSTRPGTLLRPTRRWPPPSPWPTSSVAPASTCRSRSGAGCAPTRRDRPTPTTSPRWPSSCIAVRASCRTLRSAPAPGSRHSTARRFPTTWWSSAPATPTSACVRPSRTRSP